MENWRWSTKPRKSFFLSLKTSNWNELSGATREAVQLLPWYVGKQMCAKHLWLFSALIFLCCKRVNESNKCMHVKKWGVKSKLSGKWLHCKCYNTWVSVMRSSLLVNLICFNYAKRSIRAAHAFFLAFTFSSNCVKYMCIMAVKVAEKLKPVPCFGKKGTAFLSEGCSGSLVLSWKLLVYEKAPAAWNKEKEKESSSSCACEQCAI